jgi:hypothetical protein
MTWADALKRTAETRKPVACATGSSLRQTDLLIDRLAVSESVGAIVFLAIVFAI